MPSDLGHYTIQDYLDRLASPAPTPGGGAAIALTGANAAALIAMAVAVSGDALFADLPGGGAALRERAATLQQGFFALADQDAKAFAEVMAAFAMPRTTADETARRATALDVSLRQAIHVPMQVVANALDLLRLAGPLIPRAKKHVVSDIGCALRLAEAAVLATFYTVLINLASIKDQVFDQATRQQLKSSETLARELAEQGSAAIKARIDKGP